MPNNLNAKFSIPNRVAFAEGNNGYPTAILTNDSGEAEIYLHGAHVTSLRLNAHPDPILWISPQAIFAKGKAIRGGVPICWPWFGPHPSDATKSAHGFARNHEWTVAGTRAEDGKSTVTFSLEQSAATLEQWPFEFQLQYSVCLSDRLTMCLEFQNTSSQPTTVGCALHTYFQVSQIENATVNFESSTEYLDKLQGMNRKTQSGPVVFHQEVDRVYLSPGDTALIHDSGLDRTINVASQGSRSTVVWNPWIDKSKKMGDFPDDGYKTMLCVETANAADDVRTVRPSERHVVSQTISLA